MSQGEKIRRVSAADTFLDGYHQRRDEAYDMGSRYETKGHLGQLIMRLTHRGDRGHLLEIGRGIYKRSHYREDVIRAENEEIMKDWSK